MTRDEAIEVYTKSMGYSNLKMDDFVGRTVDTMAALGILKLDEPKKPDPVADLIVEMRSRGASVCIQDVEGALRILGLKIVEAK